jgi:hypothetical protein
MNKRKRGGIMIKPYIEKNIITISHSQTRFPHDFVIISAGLRQTKEIHSKT